MPAESQLERSLCRWARDHGILAMKLTARGGTQAGQPDRMFLRNGKCCFIEFKAKGGRVRPLQHLWLKRLNDQGFAATWCDNIADAQAFLKEELGV